MVNQSQVNDPRCWEQWKTAGAVGTLDDAARRVLPGAPHFSRYLAQTLSGRLEISGPDVIDTSYGIPFAKQWTVMLDGVEIGKYRTFGPKPGEKEFAREYSGRIPGYVNSCIAVGNQFKPAGEQSPVDVVVLDFSNEKFMYIDEALLPHLERYEEPLTMEALRRLEEEHPYRAGGYNRTLLVKTHWQRQDGHTQISFP